MFRPGSFAVVVFLAGGPAYAQDRTVEIDHVTRYRRAKPLALSADDINAYAGRYESDVLKSFFTVTPGANGLLFSLNGTAGQNLGFRPVHPDTFQRVNITMRFRRDSAGNVVGLDLNNPVFRKGEYTRSRG